jgi:DNA-binding SARP family transcriptional activator/tetratricopeptide (TPR) repeat protein
VGPPKRRVLLAALLLSAGRPVPVADLTDAIWADAPPDHPRRTVQMYVTRLRTLLEDAEPGAGALVVTSADGYLIDVAVEQVDLLRFERRLADADSAAERSDPDAESAALVGALAEWRGEPLSDVPSELLRREAVPRLRWQRIRAIERRIDLDLRRGRHAEMVDELRTLTAQEPLREPLWAQLMRALDGSGRRSDALAAYQTARHHLADEAGLDPGEELQQLHATILAGRPPDAKAPVGLPVPRQLPPDVRGFTGRAEQLARLDALLTGGRSAEGVVVISAIAGTAGVGKTALAVHWARQVADRFPDGQLWVNLRGYHPGQAVTPGQALTGFLRALGVPGAKIPIDLDEQTARYRSLMENRRMLVVLDNAHSPEQVRPLLPGAPGCLVLVTSRNRLTSLVAAEAAQPLVLDLLPVDEARRLLAVRLGAERVAAEPEATDEIINRCARLPLALAIAAAHAARRPDFPLATLAAQLRDEGSRLDMLGSGDAATDARAVFSWSYQVLSPAAGWLFRLLGLCPGPHISVPAIASLAALSLSDARALLAELSDAHLVNEYVPGRYGLHDLLRAYAAERALAHDDQADRGAALHRLLDHYLHSGAAAARLLDPRRQAVAIAEPQPGVTAEDFTDLEQALAWYAAEHTALLAMIEHAAAAAFSVHTWQLAWVTSDFLNRRGFWYDFRSTQYKALAAAQRLADQHAQAMAHRYIGKATTNLGQYTEATSHLERAIELFRKVDDQIGEGHAYLDLSGVYEDRGRLTEALDHGRQSLERYVAAGHRRGQARALNTLGWFNARLGDYRTALDQCQRALALQQEVDDDIGAATTWDSLGYAHHRLGHHRQAVDCYGHAIDLFERLGIRFELASTLVNLGDTHRAAGDLEAARDAWRRALTVLEELNHPVTDDVRAKLQAIG